jgi:hypothetical protein
MNRFQLVLATNGGQEGTIVNNELHAVYYDPPENLIHVFNCGTGEDQCIVPYPSGPKPVVIFYLQVTEKKVVEVYRMYQPITESRLRSKLAELSNADLSEYINNGTFNLDENGENTTGSSGKDALFSWKGLGLFDISIPLPYFFWLALAAVTGYKTITTKNVGRYIFGAITVIAVGNAINKRNKDKN